MLITTRRRNRALLRAFSIVMATAAGLLVGLVAFVAGSDLWPAWMAAVVFGVGTVGWLNPDAARAALTAWDRGSHAVARFARAALTVTAFGIIALAGRAGSRLPWRPPRPGASGWTPRAPLRADAFGSQWTAPGGGDGWVRNLLAWAARSNNLWAWALLPPLLLLSGIQLTNRRSLGGATYTLY